jgi:hypothetical protein
MAPDNRAAAFGLGVEFGAPYIVVVLAALACTTTLDPSIELGEDDGSAGTGGQPVANCELFTSETKEYLMCPERLSQEAAAADCERRDASLVAVESAEENAFVATNSELVTMGDWWLGGTRDDAFVWSWPDGAVFWRGGPDGMAETGAFVRWKPGEPNNSSTTSPDPERCLALTPADDWNDRACALRVPYICERSP